MKAKNFNTRITLSCGDEIVTNLSKNELLKDLKLTPFITLTQYYKVNKAKTHYDTDNYVDYFEEITINRNQITSILFSQK